MARLCESDVEEAALEWLEELQWATIPGPEIAPESPGEERKSYGDVVLEERLRSALADLNPTLPSEAVDDAYRPLDPTGRCLA